jgi:amidase
MKRLSKDRVCYAMSGANEPALRVASGEVFCVETEDCYSGCLRRPEDRIPESMGGFGNPATGPVAVEGAAPGDLLRVEIERIETRDYAVMHVGPGKGALAEQIAADETVVLPIEGGELLLRSDVRVPIRPMIGVIGTAPAGEDVPTITPGEHGGNLDCREIAAGAVVYLPVNVEGGLLALGDLHAVMGDGEVCICGAEVSGEVTLRAQAVRSALPTPCVETAEWVVFLGSALSLDDCERMVLDKAHRFLTERVGLGANEAARVMSLVGELRVCQVVDPLKTMKFMLPKPVLRGLGMASDVL